MERWSMAITAFSASRVTRGWAVRVTVCGVCAWMIVIVLSVGVGGTKR